MPFIFVNMKINVYTNIGRFTNHFFDLLQKCRMIGNMLTK